jgi:hypothetical protein
VRYFVIGDGGQHYGPADVDQLKVWVQEGRIIPRTLLKPEQGGATIPARDLPELGFPKFDSPPTRKPFMPSNVGSRGGGLSWSRWGGVFQSRPDPPIDPGVGPVYLRNANVSLGIGAVLCVCGATVLPVFLGIALALVANGIGAYFAFKANEVNEIGSGGALMTAGLLFVFIIGLGLFRWLG